MDEFVVESTSEVPARPIDPRRALLLPLWRGRRLVLAATLFGVVGGILFGITRPNSYRSYAKLMIRAGAREELTPEMSVTGNAGGFAMGRNVVNDEMHLLSAERVFEETARIVTPQEVFRPYDPSALDDADTPGLLALFHRGQSWWFRNTPGSGDVPNHEIDGCEQCVRLAAKVVSRNLLLDPSPGSNVITVSYTASDPQLAQKIVAAFIEAAISHHRKVYETNSTLEFLGGQMEKSLRDLTIVENEFTNFKTQCGVFDFKTQQTTLMTSIQLLESETAQDQSHLEELRGSAKYLTALVASLPETIEERTEQNLQANPERAVLRQHILTLETSLSTLEGRVGGTTRDRDGEREQLTSRIESMRKELEKQPEFVDAGPLVRRVVNPQREHLTQNLYDTNRELASLEGASAVRAGQLREAKERLQAIVLCEPQFTSLDATTTEARHRFDSCRAARERASVMGSMDQPEMSNLRRIQEATLPSEKEGPLRGKLLLLGVLLGGVAGCALAFAKNLLDHRLHDAAEVQLFVGTPVLAELPELGSPAGVRTLAARRAAL
jgi:uncharacterized protein involved in exopolysaccharide biosynthesis